MMKKVLGFGAALIVTVGSSWATPINLGSFSVSPGGTFLEQTSNDNCSFGTASQFCNTAGFFNPTIVNLSTLGVNPGDILTLTSGGTINYGTATTNAFVDALFSTSTTLLASNFLNRVTGAIGPPTGVGGPALKYSTAMYFGGSNMIAGDFSTSGGGTSVYVPTGAKYLFLGIADSFYADNSGSASVTLTDLPAVPEPSTFALMLTGLAGAAFAARRRFRKN